MSHTDEAPPSVDVLLAQIAALEAKNANLRNMVAAEVGLRQTAEAEGKTWQYLAYVDALTGMFNRHHGDAVFEKHQKERKDKQCGLDASGSTRFTILFIDLDKFGQINKEHGDQTGDEALRVVAQTILQNIRKADLPYAYRKGGDEFVVGLKHTSKEEAQIVINRLVTALDGAIKITAPNGEIISIRGSIGVYEWNDTLDIEGNFAKADEQMRAAKKERHKAQRLAECDFDPHFGPYEMGNTPPKIYQILPSIGKLVIV